jgi:anthranilate phosphoribosyltransferase
MIFAIKDYGVSYSKVFENITLEENLNILRNYDDEILKLS